MLALEVKSTPQLPTLAFRRAGEAARAGPATSATSYCFFIGSDALAAASCRGIKLMGRGASYEAAIQYWAETFGCRGRFLMMILVGAPHRG